MARVGDGVMRGPEGEIVWAESSMEGSVVSFGRGVCLWARLCWYGGFFIFFGPWAMGTKLRVGSLAGLVAIVWYFFLLMATILFRRGVVFCNSMFLLLEHLVLCLFRRLVSSLTISSGCLAFFVDLDCVRFKRITFLNDASKEEHQSLELEMYWLEFFAIVEKENT
jgi:hypothetical protein